MRFKVDENLPTELADLLRKHGHDALTVPDENIAGIRDAELHAICKKEERALVTLDTDFSDIRSCPPEELPSTIVLRVAQQSKKHVLKVFSAILPLLELEPLDRHLWIVEEGRVRVRGKDVRE
jgi:predicted nuclease of predicted toxin-antitoxin system